MSLEWGPTVPALSLPLHKAVRLESLHLWKLKPDITQLAALTGLTKLSLRNCDIDDANVCSLSTLTGLRSLNLGLNPDITGAQGSMEVLAKSMPQLYFLKLSETAAQEAAQDAFQGRSM